MTAAEARELTVKKQRETLEEDLKKVISTIEEQAKLGRNCATIHTLKELVKEQLLEDKYKIRYQNKFGTWVVSW